MCIFVRQCHFTNCVAFRDRYHSEPVPGKLIGFASLQMNSQRVKIQNICEDPKEVDGEGMSRYLCLMSQCQFLPARGIFWPALDVWQVHLVLRTRFTAKQMQNVGMNGEGGSCQWHN